MPRASRAVRNALRWARSVSTVALIVYFGVDAVTSEFCSVQQQARPLGIAAAIALTLIVISSRITVCLSCIVTLIGCRDHTTAADAAAVVTFLLWCKPEGGELLIMGVIPFAVAHATTCKAPSSAALSVLCIFHVLRLGTVKAARWLCRRALRRRYIALSEKQSLD
jgi:hypothetical protein